MVAGRLKRWLVGLNCVALATAILCCTASIKPQRVTEEEILAKRVNEYWAYKIKGDLDKCYGYEVPSYRERVNVVDYIRSQGQILRWTEAEVRKVEMDGVDRARVDAFIKFRYQIPQFRIDKGESSVSENWVKVKGEWYHVPSGFVFQ